MNKKFQTVIIWLVGVVIASLIVMIGMKDSINRKIYAPTKEYPSVLASEELIKTDLEGLYYLPRKMTKLKGRTNFDKDAEQIHIKITTAREYEIYDQQIKYQPEWTIKIPGLTYGMNHVCVEYIYEDTSQSYDYVIYNYCQSNCDSLPMMDIDSDGDGLTDYFELTDTKTDPNNADSDGNSIPDGEEDLDNDGLSNLEEMHLGTMTTAMDSDIDGLSDGEEVQYGTDPLKSDTDGDGYSDYLEVKIGTDPNNKKSPGKDAIVTYTEAKDFYSHMNIEVTLSTTADNIESFHIYEIPESFTVSSSNIKGMIGAGIALIIDNEPESADINITLDCDDYVEGQSYYLYYINESTMKPEYVRSQNQTGNVITAHLEHFSKYCISSLNEEETKREYANRRIDLVTNERKEALFDSYAEYIAAIYKDQAVFSINIYTGDVDDPYAYVLDNGISGHSWTSYYYAGNDSALKLSNIDKRIDDSECFGAIGFGGWINEPDELEKLWKTWDGSMKFPNGYRELYYDGKKTSDGNIIYQSDTIPYAGSNMVPEHMDRAYISMPFVIDSSNMTLISEFVNSYTKQYDLDVNNCTTFVKELMAHAKITNHLIIDYSKENTSMHNIIYNIGNRYVGEAGSPGQASYYIQQAYPNEHVYVLEEVLEDGSSKLWFTSKMAQDMKVPDYVTNQRFVTDKAPKGFTFNEEIGDKTNSALTDINNKLSQKAEKQTAAFKDFILDKFEAWLDKWVAENCGAC